jgi:uncharacterized protein YjaZ
MNDEIEIDLVTEDNTFETDFVGDAEELNAEFDSIIPLKGDKGEDGYSPTITEAVNTDTEYRLEVTTKDGTFTTPNLKAKEQKEYIKTVTEDLWEQVGNEYRVQIYQTEHKVDNIKQIIVQIKDANSECYEDVCYSYKIYFSGKVAIILDKKINCRIIIKGD